MFKFWKRQQKQTFEDLDKMFPLGIGIQFGSGRPITKEGKEVLALSVAIISKVTDNAEWIRKRIMHEVKEGESAAMALAEVLEAVSVECRRLHRAQKKVVDDVQSSLKVLSSDAPQEEIPLGV